ncbi:hypothetical protein Bbelb_268100 [Branchiostoma belcheri]|nr:hypothetical protein Bbelb_268100 [Branchiostoma belcheri]
MAGRLLLHTLVLHGLFLVNGSAHPGYTQRGDTSYNTSERFGPSRVHPARRHLLQHKVYVNGSAHPGYTQRGDTSYNTSERFGPSRVHPARRHLLQVNGSAHPGYTLRGDTSYKVFTEAMSYHRAEMTCEADGGHLVDIKTQSLHNFILDMVRQANRYQDYWIGLNDKRTPNVWTWSDGSPLSGCGFSMWAPGEPNNGGGQGQDCGQLWAAVGLRWDDDFCYVQKRFICQIGPGENGACSGGGCHVANGGCDQICTSDGPNVTCDCRIGYVLKDDGYTCTGIQDSYTYGYLPSGGAAGPGEMLPGTLQACEGLYNSTVWQGKQDVYWM